MTNEIKRRINLLILLARTRSPYETFMEKITTIVLNAIPRDLADEVYPTYYRYKIEWSILWIENIKDYTLDEIHDYFTAILGYPVDLTEDDGLIEITFKLPEMTINNV